MSLPIDEMSSDLRSAPEEFEGNPCDETFAKVQLEALMIKSCCEDSLAGEEEP